MIVLSRFVVASIGSRAILLRGIAASLVGILAIARPATAINVWLSDETGFDFHDGPYAINEIVYVSGEWDVFDFPCPVGRVFLVPNDRTSWGSTRPIGPFVTHKTVQGCYGAGAFYGEYLKLPPLPPGEYDVVLDEHEDGWFDAGIDFVLGNGPAAGLKVIDQTLDQQIDVAGIKSAAAALAVDWQHTADWTAVTFRGLGLIGFAGQISKIAHVSAIYGTQAPVAGYAVLGIGSQVTGFPISYNGVSLGLGARMIAQASATNARIQWDIANDPPDPAYGVRVELESIDYRPELSSRPLEYNAVRLQNNLQEQAVIGTAFRRSYEKFLGAEMAEDYSFALTQARASREYADLMIETLQSCARLLDSLENAVVATGHADSVMPADSSRALQQRIAGSGFTASERAQLASIGMTVDEIDSVRVAIVGLPLAALVDVSFRALLDSLETQASRSISGFESARSQLDAVLVGLENNWTDDPRAVISGGISVLEGASLALDGTASLEPHGLQPTFAWDLDLDGDFDDGSGPVASFVSLRAGEYLVGLRVATGHGSDVAYRRILVGEVDRMPLVTSWSPEPAFLELAVGAVQRFSVTAVDPESDPITYSWFLDGVPAGAGTTYDFVSQSPSTHDVAVLADDGSPLSRDPFQTWRVRVGNGATAVGSEAATGRALRVLRVEPNPFKGSCQVRFEVPQATFLEIGVHSIDGRRVATLARGRYPAGSFDAVWDGRDGRDRRAAPGIYHVVIQAGERHDVARLVLLR